MDPLHFSSLVTSSHGVARLGGTLRRLQQDLKGALDDVDTIVGQTSTIEFAIGEICSLVRHSSNAFPPRFESRLTECTSSIDKVVGQIQAHTQSVKAKAEKSRLQAQLLHVRHAEKVGRWENSLGAQIQTLMLLLDVARLFVSPKKYKP